ncbi:MAG: manganese catalase family protein, partial [Bacilli bacterium]|nr:manganese catalase family protein [Bacilli bacterium]
MEENPNLDVYHSDMPYPEIKVTEKNPEYANLLLDDYVGFVSEMTAVNQYYYHYIEIKKIDEEIADMLFNISIVEMQHLNVLAKLISLLGEKPIYKSGDNYWNGDFVYYGDNILSQLEADLQAEYDAIENYEKNIDLIDDPYIKNILRRIVLDEEIHVQL